MGETKRHELSQGQISLSFILTVTTFSCILAAVVSQRSALGVLLWSIAGIACGSRLRQTYLRRSVLVMLAGCSLVALGQIFTPNYDQHWFSFGTVLLGGTITFSCGFATLANVINR
ncbi:MAG: hypothetical protein R3C28_27640 [Pirellulaceae bacterium]